MDNRSDASNTGFSRKSAILSGLCLAVVSGAIVLFSCSSRLDSAREHVLRGYEEHVSAWLSGTDTAVDLWRKDMAEQRLRISGSETYRLFASDLFGLDKRVAGSINENVHRFANTEKNTAALSEEVPVIRRILFDFMNYNGLLDVRLINAAGQTILSATNSPVPLSQEQGKAAQQVMKDGSLQVLPIRSTVNGLVLDVFEPMYDLEAQDTRVAVFMSSQPILAQVTQFLARPKQEDLAVASLIQRNGTSWEYVQMPAPRPLDANFSAQLTDQGGKLPFSLRESVQNGSSVYSSSIFIPGLNWGIVHEIPAEVVNRSIFHAELPIYIVGMLSWMSILLIGALLWWIGIGRREKSITAELRRLNQLVLRQKELLDCVNISLDIGVFMADVKGQIRVCNRALAAIFNLEEKDVNDQNLVSIFSSGDSSELLDRIRKVALENREDGFEMSMDQNGSSRLYRMTLYPFLDASEGNMHKSIRGAVVTMSDITEFRRRSERMRLQQQSLITAFARAEESADPYLYGHSRRMSALGALIADSLGMGEDGKNTIVMGSMLSQMGKLFVPRELLTKKGRLTEEELAEVRKAPEHAWNLVKDIEFDLPVPRALYEMYENMDGSGYPRGLSGEDILPEARVLSVLNAFCAMVSARSYREGMSEKDAMKILKDNPCFDQHVVEHLGKVLETPEGCLAIKE
jgi:PAS domain S-box-containing protein